MTIPHFPHFRLAGVLIAAVALVAGGLWAGRAGSQDFRFVILGDRTGGAQPGVFEEALREGQAAHPDFLLTVGDAIEGGEDAQTEGEWKALLPTVQRQTRAIPVFFTPGNHDVWSERSARLFERFTKRPLHYSFDYGQAHFTVLDTSRAEQLSSDELSYLERDLASRKAQPLKFVVTHRPSWILQALLGDRKSLYQQLANKYHVQYFIAGHIHQMLYFHVGEVHYLSMPSAGGHLRGDKRYESGWFFATTLVQIHGTSVSFSIQELAAPLGAGRVTSPSDWGAAGLVARSTSGTR